MKTRSSISAPVVCFLLVLAFFTACKGPEPEPTNTIDPVLQPYVDAFLREAKIRNYPIENGFTVKFGKSFPNTGGYADYKQKLIVIDSTVWRTSNEEYHELTLWHELGHLLLNRQHITKGLANGEIGTIMYSLERPITATEPTQQPIFRGIRKAFYIDELFDARTKEPDFVQSSYAPFSAKTRKLIGRLDFSDASAPLRAYVESQKNCDCVLRKNDLLVQLPKGYGFGMAVDQMLKVLGMSQQDIDTKLRLPNYEIEIGYKPISKGFLMQYYDWKLPRSDVYYQFVLDVNAGFWLVQSTRDDYKKIAFIAKPSESALNTIKITKSGNFFNVVLNDANVFYTESLPDGVPFVFGIGGSGEGAAFSLDHITFNELQ